MRCLCGPTAPFRGRSAMDDLLPFNVIVSDDRAVLIDWEYGGILPYPSSFARLIAHGEEAEDSLFHMTREDRGLRYRSLL